MLQSQVTSVSRKLYRSKKEHICDLLKVQNIGQGGHNPKSMDSRMVPHFKEECPLGRTVLVVPYCPTRELRSLNAGLLLVPRVLKSRMGARAFSYQAPLLWNQLPPSVREAVPSFKSRLKTFLFSLMTRRRRQRILWKLS